MHLPASHCLPSTWPSQKRKKEKTERETLGSAVSLRSERRRRWSEAEMRGRRRVSQVLAVFITEKKMEISAERPAQGFDRRSLHGRRQQVTLHNEIAEKDTEARMKVFTWRELDSLRFLETRPRCSQKTSEAPRSSKPVWSAVAALWRPCSLKDMAACQWGC